MKKQLFKRALSAFLAMVMVVLLIPASVLTTNAAEETVTVGETTALGIVTAADVSSSAIFLTAIERYRISNTYSYEQICMYIELQNKENKDGFDKKIEKIGKIGGYIGFALNLIFIINNEAAQETPFWDAVGNIATSLLSSFLGIQFPWQESESEILLKEMRKMMDEVNAKLDDLSESVDELSKKVDLNTTNLASYMWYLQEFGNDMTVLDEFTQGSDTAAYSYYRDRDRMYEAYDELMFLLESKEASESDIKKAYDKLYIRAIKVEQLHEYITGENKKLTNQKSILEALYEYSILSKYLCSKGEAVDENGNLEDVEVKCVEFAEDLYTTYLFSNYALTLCYNYQVEYLTSDGGTLLTYYDVDGMEGTNDILGSSIFGNDKTIGRIPSMLEKQKIIEKEIASYIVYVLNLGGDYLYENGAMPGMVYNVPRMQILNDENAYKSALYQVSYGDFCDTIYIRTNDVVSAGDTLYMNLLPENIAAMFTDGSFTFTVDRPDLATVNNSGVVNVIGESGTFTITMKYDDVNVYSLNFNITDRAFSGGMGTEHSPYLISKWEDIEEMAAWVDAVSQSTQQGSQNNVYFKLVQDINCEGKSFEGISQFNGIFDGNGHCIYNFVITKSDPYAGFFCSLQENAIVKDLTLGQDNGTDDYSITISTAVTIAPATDGPNVHVGAIAGRNYGTIWNCSVEDAYVFGSWIVSNSSSQYEIVSCVGGVVGGNYGTVRDCTVKNAYIAGDSTDNAADWDVAKAESKVGGVCGHNDKGTVDNCYVSALRMFACAHSRKGSMSLPVTHHEGIFIGDIVGQATNAALVRNCDAEAETIERTRVTKLPAIGDAKVYIGGLVAYYEGAIIEQEYNGHRYRLYGTKLYWPDAKIDCESKGGHLITITSAEEATFAWQLVSNQNTWIGCSDDAKEGTFVWVNGEPFEYSNWESKQPDNKWDSDYVYLWAGYDGKWDDTTHEYEYYYICEWDSIESTTNGTKADESDNSGNVEDTESYKTEYICGETHVKSADDKNIYPLQTHRIDTSIDVSADTPTGSNIIVLEPIPQSSTYKKTIIPIMVKEESAIEFRVYTPPKKNVYLLNDVLDLTGIRLAVIFDNGRVEVLENGDSGYSVDQADFSVLGASAISLSYSNLKVEIPVTVVSCLHEDTNEVEEIAPTCGTDGHEAGTQCAECGEYISGGEIIPATENHTWDNGVVTLDPTQTATGIMTYTCTACSAVKNEVIPIPEITENEPTLYIKDIYATPGSTFSVDVAIKNNPGISAISFTLNYDRTVLTLENVQNGGLLPSMTVGNQVVLSASDSVYGDQTVVTLTFKINDHATLGDYSIGLTNRGCIGENEASVSVATLSGTLTVGNIIWGDATGDGIVDITDVVRLMKYLAEYDYETDSSPINISSGADATGDGIVDITDVVRLMKYLAEYDYETESSPIVLGRPL